MHASYTVARETEQQAQQNRSRAARGGENTPDSTANGVWKILDETDEPEA
jgi:hypothetical protein